MSVCKYDKKSKINKTFSVLLFLILLGTQFKGTWLFTIHQGEFPLEAHLFLKKTQWWIARSINKFHSKVLELKDGSCECHSYKERFRFIVLPWTSQHFYKNISMIQKCLSTVGNHRKLCINLLHEQYYG